MIPQPKLGEFEPPTTRQLVALDQHDHCQRCGAREVALYPIPGRVADLGGRSCIPCLTIGEAARLALRLKVVRRC